MNLSSVAAVAPIPFQTYYSASKAAVNAYTMALANEVRPFGITVCAVQPGDIATGFTSRPGEVSGRDQAYNGRIGRSVARMEHDETAGMSPASAGAFIGRVALRRSHHPLYTIGGFYRFAVLLLKLLPASAGNWLWAGCMQAKCAKLPCLNGGLDMAILRVLSGSTGGAFCGDRGRSQ